MLHQFSFEVFGRVQGVFFRRYTVQQAKRLGLTGFCSNTNSQSVKGVAEGEPDKLSEFKHWLERTGSPKSRIDRLETSPMKSIYSRSFSEFTQR
ncbi:hypothetical protein GEMRC1_001976 [Eukaryota sp. GEM-RC1]